MALEAHIEELQRKHHEVDGEIRDALSSPGFPDFEITAMKRRKLAIKDKIHRLRTTSTAHA